jgi:hypothetical protein
MSEQPAGTEYLVICRGQWDKTLSQDEIQSAIEKFYIWYDRLINEGKMKPGQHTLSGLSIWCFFGRLSSAVRPGYQAQS